MSPAVGGQRSSPKSGRRGETFIGRDGGGETMKSRGSFDRFLSPNGTLRWEMQRLGACLFLVSADLVSVISGFSVTFCGAEEQQSVACLQAPSKHSGPAVTEIDTI